MGSMALPIAAVVFDVGETLVDETEAWGDWADWLGVPRLTLFAALGAVDRPGRSIIARRSGRFDRGSISRPRCARATLPDAGTRSPRPTCTPTHCRACRHWPWRGC